MWGYTAEYSPSSKNEVARTGNHTMTPVSEQAHTDGLDPSPYSLVACENVTISILFNDHKL